MTPAQKQVYDILLRIRTEKREKRRFPDFCLGVELSRHLGTITREEARETVKELESGGYIRTGPTINDRYLEIIDVPAAPPESLEPQPEQQSLFTN